LGALPVGLSFCSQGLLLLFRFHLCFVSLTSQRKNTASLKAHFVVQSVVDSANLVLGQRFFPLLEAMVLLWMSRADCWRMVLLCCWLILFALNLLALLFIDVNRINTESITNGESLASQLHSRVIAGLAACLPDILEALRT
jgi:hypothetical protein